MIDKRFEYLLPRPCEKTGTRVELNNYEKELPNDKAADSLIKRFNKAARNSGKIEDYMKHEAFLSKSLRRAEKQKKAKIRRIQFAKKHIKKKNNLLY